MPNQPGWNQHWGQGQQQPQNWQGQQQRWQGQPQQGWQPQPQPPKKRRKWPFIVLPLVSLFVVWLIVRLSFELTREDIPPVADPGPVSNVTEPSIEATPTPPGAPVVCQPNLPYRCFPDDYNPDAAMDAIASEGWTCFKEGERNDAGALIFEPRECQTYDNAGQPYGIRASINYERDFPNSSDGRLHAFNLKVITSAALKRGEETSPEDPTRALGKVFDLVSKHIWQGKPEELKEATETFERLKSQCASPEGRTINGVTLTTPKGYELTCSSSGGIALGDEAQTYQQSLKINPSNR